MRKRADRRLGAHDMAGWLEPLSKREIEVLRLLALGLSNHEIAQALVIAENTVKMHLKHLYGKLSVHNRVQAITHAQARQLLQ